MSSVVIEGTICITSGAGRTTVLQVADKFGGTIPEGLDNFMHASKPPLPGQTLLTSGYHNAPHVDTMHHHHQHHHGSTAASMAAYFEELSPASMVSPNHEISPPHAGGRENRSNSAPGPLRKAARMELQARDASPLLRIKREIVSEDSSSDDRAEDMSSGPVCPGTGYYTPFSANGTMEEDVSEDEADKLQIVEEANKDTDSSSQGLDLSDSGIALDLTRREDDLSLSSPQSYTAQVRDVIRQRLLAGRLGKAALGKSLNATPTRTSETPTSEQRGTKREWSMIATEKLPQSFMTPPGLGIINGGSPLMTSTPTTAQVLSHSYPGALKISSSATLHDMLTRRTLLTPDGTTTDQRASPLTTRTHDDIDIREGGGVLAEQKVYKCDFCPKTFLFKSKYHEHLPVHTNVRPFQCHMCSRTYKYKYDLRVHLRTHAGIPTKSTICPFCNAKFDTNKVLRQHISDHHAEKQAMAEPQDCHNVLQAPDQTRQTPADTNKHTEQPPPPEQQVAEDRPKPLLEHPSTPLRPESPVISAARVLSPV